MEYTIGEKICISVETMISGDADMDYVDVVAERNGTESFFALVNEFGEICCLDGEECTVDHIVNGTNDVYDLLNNNGETAVHFMLSKSDMDIAVFR